MNIIKSEKIDKRIVIAALYLAFCFAYFVPMRGQVALMNVDYGLPNFLANDVFSFFVAGVMPIILFEAISSSAFRFMRTRGNTSAPDMQYSLRFFYFPAAIVLGLVKLIFLFHPIAGVWGNVLSDVVVPTIFFALYMVYIIRRFDKFLYPRLIYELGGTFVIVYGAYTLSVLLIGVIPI